MTKPEGRPGSKWLFYILRKDGVLVVRWINRLGCNYQDVIDTIRLLMRKNVIIHVMINNMIFDGCHHHSVSEKRIVPVLTRLIEQHSLLVVCCNFANYILSLILHGCAIN